MPAKGRAKLTPEQIDKLIQEYFEHCDSTVRAVQIGKRVAEVQTPYSLAGLAAYMDLSRDTLYEWSNGKYPVSDDTEGSRDIQNRVSDSIMRARRRIEASLLERSLTGELDSKIAALILGHMGYAAKQEVQHSGNMAVTWQGSTAQDAEEWSR